MKLKKIKVKKNKNTMNRETYKNISGSTRIYYSNSSPISNSRIFHFWYLDSSSIYYSLFITIITS